MDLRFAIGGMNIETNSFSGKPADLEWFKSYGYYEGRDLLSAFSKTNSVGGGIMDAAEAFGWELVPLVVTTPMGAGGGVVTEETLDFVVNRIVELAKKAGHLDGMFALLHGAMVAEKHPDGEGYISSVLRENFGEDFPLATTFDFQGAISQQIVDNCDVVLGYDTYPHTDWYDRGFESAKLLRAVQRDKKRITRALNKPKILPNLPGEYTGRHPMATLIDAAHRFEEQQGVLYVTVNPGFPYCDAPHAGLSIVVGTDGDEKLAEQAAQELEALAWDNKDGFVAKCVDVDEAIDRAITPEFAYRTGPTVLGDEGDAVFGGSPGNGVSILKRLLERHVQGGAVFLLEPAAAAKAIQAGVGAEVHLVLGGSIDGPIDVRGRVKVVTDGEFEPIMLRGRVDKHTFSMGKTATLRCDGTDVVLISRPAQFNFLEEWRNVGVEPLAKSILAIKSPVHFREHFEPVASRIIEVDTPGKTTPNLATLNYQHMRRPIVPLDKF